MDEVHNQANRKHQFPIEVAEVRWNKFRESRHGCLASFRGAGCPIGSVRLFRISTRETTSSGAAGTLYKRKGKRGKLLSPSCPGVGWNPTTLVVRRSLTQSPSVA